MNFIAFCKPDHLTSPVHLQFEGLGSPRSPGSPGSPGSHAQQPLRAPGRVQSAGRAVRGAAVAGAGPALLGAGQRGPAVHDLQREVHPGEEAAPLPGLREGAVRAVLQ